MCHPVCARSRVPPALSAIHSFIPGLTFCAADEEEAAVGELGQVLWRRVGAELDRPVLRRVGHVLGSPQPEITSN